MPLSINQVREAYQTYQKQERIGEANRKHAFNTVQTQRDKVTLSDQSIELLKKSSESNDGSTPTPENGDHANRTFLDSDLP